MAQPHMIKTVHVIHNDPDEIVRLVVYNCINGDNTLLDAKLEQLRTIDSLAKY
jgi:hypothetical protein